MADDKLRALTMLNERGDTTIVWTEDRDDEMEAIIEKKMAQGCSFYIIEPRFGTREQLTELNMRKLRKDRMLAIPDADLLKFGGGVTDVDADTVRLKSEAVPLAITDESEPSAAAIPSPATPVKRGRRAKTAKDVAQNESIGVAPRRGG